MRTTWDCKDGQQPTWRNPLLAGFLASLQWALAFAFLSYDSTSKFSGIACITVLFTAAVARKPERVLAVRGRWWLGAFLFGVGHIPALAWAHWYIWQTAAPALVPLLIYLCLFPAATVYLCARVFEKRPSLPAVAVAPVIWVAVEIVRGEWLVGGYPWLLLGHTLTPQTGPSWLAPLIGAYGCSLLLAVIGSGFYDLISRIKDVKKQAAWYGGAVGVLPLLLWLLLGSSADPSHASTFRVSVIQTNLPQDNKIGWRLGERVPVHQRWLNLTEKAATQARPPALVVWPETMFAGQALNPEALEAQRRAGLTYSVGVGLDRHDLPATWFADELCEVQQKTNVPFLIGSIAIDGMDFERVDGGIRTLSKSRTNSAVLITGGKPQPERYDKIDLMAFGEYIPVAYRWPAIQQWLIGLGAKGMTFDLAFGEKKTVFTVGATRLVTPICFEVCHESLCRELVFDAGGTRRADILVNITNDGWFYESDYNRRMHLLQARWRCAELGTPMVRAANTGVSAVIDSAGHLLTGTLDDGQQPQRTEGVLTADVPLPAPNLPATLYVRLGHHLKTAVVSIGLLLAIFAIVPIRKQTSTTT